MHTRFQPRLLATLACLALLSLAGCTRHERRQVKLTEQQHQGPVVEQPPGEMVP